MTIYNNHYHYDMKNQAKPTAFNLGAEHLNNVFSAKKKKKIKTRQIINILYIYIYIPKSKLSLHIILTFKYRLHVNTHTELYTKNGNSFRCWLPQMKNSYSLNFSSNTQNKAVIL